MKDYIEERAVEIANYIIETRATVRQTAKKFGISKSTVHISVNRRADSADIGVTFPESSAYNSAQTACFY